ncbi:MAG: hypothetical protein P4L69_21465, partial [Desulfosporosinus sp.]|nr:hypothetical protein [Desulfosporosinus sp.]
RDAVSHSATSLRKQPTKLQFRRPTPNSGQCKSSASREPSPTCTKTVHMECAVPPTFRSPTPARDAVSHSATSLRKQPSKLPFRQPTPNSGQRTRSLLAILGYRDTRPSMASGCALPAMRQGCRFGRAPRTPETGA